MEAIQTGAWRGVTATGAAKHGPAPQWQLSVKYASHVIIVLTQAPNITPYYIVLTQAPRDPNITLTLHGRRPDLGLA